MFVAASRFHANQTNPKRRAPHGQPEAATLHVRKQRNKNRAVGRASLSFLSLVSSHPDFRTILTSLPLLPSQLFLLSLLWQLSSITLQPRSRKTPPQSQPSPKCPSKDCIPSYSSIASGSSLHGTVAYQPPIRAKERKQPPSQFRPAPSRPGHHGRSCHLLRARPA